MGFLRNIGTGELIVIALVVLVFFGSKKLKELARGLGESSKELKNVKKEYEKALTMEDEPAETQAKGEEKKGEGV